MRKNKLNKLEKCLIGISLTGSSFYFIANHEFDNEKFGNYGLIPAVVAGSMFIGYRQRRKDEEREQTKQIPFSSWVSRVDNIDNIL